MVISPLYILTGLFQPTTETMQYLPKWSEWSIYAMAVLGVINLASAIAMWKWKKLGVIGFGLAIVGFFILSILRNAISPLAALLGIAICVAVLVRLVRPVWQRMA